MLKQRFVELVVEKSIRALRGALDFGESIFTGDVEVTGTINGITMLTGSVDPSAGAGLAAEMPAMYMRVTGGAGTMWYKSGAEDTSWTAVDPLD